MRHVGWRNFFLLCAARLFLLFSAVFFLLDAYNPNNLIGHIRNEFSRSLQNNIKAGSDSRTLFYTTIRLDDFTNNAESDHDIDAYMDSLMLRKTEPYIKSDNMRGTGDRYCYRTLWMPWHSLFYGLPYEMYVRVYKKEDQHMYAEVKIDRPMMIL
jgi:hypothetical protein